MGQQQSMTVMWVKEGGYEKNTECAQKHKMRFPYIPSCGWSRFRRAVRRNSDRLSRSSRTRVPSTGAHRRMGGGVGGGGGGGVRNTTSRECSGKSISSSLGGCS
mmetsp:Transcript_27020/g.62783  ORF Transcript_27020/g.62783 Transcript_27020/m.62783 type:complete len:104 (+) Transcript_27020:261-572(+)